MNVYLNYHEQVKKESIWNKENTSEYKEYRRKWESNPVEGIVDRAPIHLDIESSAICNLMCPMCGSTIEREKGEKAAYKGGLMPMELYKRIIDEASQIGVCSVKLNWRGEPLMHPNIVEMVKYAKQKGILEILINTNAVKLDKEMSIDLINAGVDKLIFSVDSIRKETYEEIRVGANFEDTINNIKYFCKINEDNGHKVSTRVQRVLLNNKEEQQEFEAFFKPIIDTIAYEEYIPYGDKALGKKERKAGVVDFKCPQIWQRMLITWEGKCFMCCSGYEEKYAIGNVYNDTIEEIWHGNKLERVRECHSKGKWDDIDVCRECYIPWYIGK